MNRIDVYDAPMVDAKVLGNFVHGDILNILDADSSETFYKIEYEGASAWVLKCYVVKTNETGIVTVSDFNASMKRTAMGYELTYNEKTDTGEYLPINLQIEKNSKVKILNGYDSRNKFTEIAFVQGSRIRVCYVETDSLAPSGMNPSIIIALSLIASILGLVFVIIGIRLRGK